VGLRALGWALPVVAAAIAGRQLRRRRPQPAPARARAVSSPIVEPITVASPPQSAVEPTIVEPIAVEPAAAEPVLVGPATVTLAVFDDGDVDDIDAGGAFDGPTPVATEARSERWEGRPIRSLLLRAFVYLVPIVASVVAALGISRVLPRPQSMAELVGWWIVLTALSTIVLVVVERLSRRLLPLASLYKLSLLFPDRAPTRFAVARALGSTKTLEERIEHARLAGQSDEPARAAEAILTLMSALSGHDRRTRGHAERVRVYTDMVADEFGLSRDDKDRLRWASLLHDIGKLAVPAKILNKPGRPTPSEWDHLKSHPEAGARFIGPLLPWLGEWARAIPEHHEQWNGTGYPHGLAGAEISLGARLVAVADSFEVMTAARPYKKAISAAAAREELARCAGTQFDPAVVRAFLNISLGRLRLAMGPLSWIAQLPFLPRIGSLGGQPVGAAAAQIGGATALAATVAIQPASVAARSLAVSAPAAAAAEPAASGEQSDGRETAADDDPSPVPSGGDIKLQLFSKSSEPLEDLPTVDPPAAPDDPTDAPTDPIREPAFASRDQSGGTPRVPTLANPSPASTPAPELTEAGEQTPAPSPTASPTPSSSPSSPPAPAPTETSEEGKIAEPKPDPAPNPSPAPSASPESPSPGPTTEPSRPDQQPPSADPTPTPTPTPSPSPTAEPSPEPAPDPTPAPDPSPSPTPEPSPEPAPDHSPDPSPTPTEEASAEPSETSSTPPPTSPSPEPSDDKGDNGNHHGRDKGKDKDKDKEDKDKGDKEQDKDKDDEGNDHGQGEHPQPPSSPPVEVPTGS